MNLLALAFCLFIVSLGGLGVVAPGRLIAVVRRFQSRRGMLVLAAIRLAMGATLLLAAPGSRTPGAIRALGVLIVISGAVTPLFGPERYRRLVDWWSEQGSLFVRVWATFALSFGLALAYAFVDGI